MRRRFLLLLGECYYPAGWTDFAGTYQSRAEARRDVPRKVGHKRKWWGSTGWWYEVVDLRTMKVVDKGQGERLTRAERQRRGERDRQRRREKEKADPMSAREARRLARLAATPAPPASDGIGVVFPP